MIFAVALIVANVVTAKTIDTGISLFGNGTVSLTSGAICYAITFLMTDVIGEIWGKKEANQAVILGLICQVIATILITIIQYIPTTNAEMQSAYEMLLGQNWVFVIGSLVAYFVSQTWDVWIFHRVRNAYINKHGTIKGGKWIWNNLSTMTSQIWDSLLFICIAFGLGFGWFWSNPVGLVNMFIGQYFIKLIIAALDTPIFYLLTRHSEKQTKTTTI